MPRGWGEGRGAGRVLATALGFVLALSRSSPKNRCCYYSALYSAIGGLRQKSLQRILLGGLRQKSLQRTLLGGLRQKEIQRVLKRICRSFRPTGRADAVAAGGVTQLLFERTGKFTKVEGCKSEGGAKVGGCSLIRLQFDPVAG